MPLKKRRGKTWPLLYSEKFLKNADSSASLTAHTEFSKYLNRTLLQITAGSWEPIQIKRFGTTYTLLMGGRFLKSVTPVSRNTASLNYVVN